MSNGFCTRDTTTPLFTPPGVPVVPVSTITKCKSLHKDTPARSAPPFATLASSKRHLFFCAFSVFLFLLFRAAAALSFVFLLLGDVCKNVGLALSLLGDACCEGD